MNDAEGEAQRSATGHRMKQIDAYIMLWLAIELAASRCCCAGDVSIVRRNSPLTRFIAALPAMRSDDRLDSS
jgi:hypothetical protein